jgi:GNAT superfamily N-acetyltransferase
MIRSLGDGYELDDDRARVDLEAVHAFLTTSYWAEGRPLAEVRRLVGEAARIVGVYHEGAQVGFCRAVSDAMSIAYLADVYVLEQHRGRGLGVELVREMVENGPLSRVRWVLHTRDAHGLYRQFGFGEPSERLMERTLT